MATGRVPTTANSPLTAKGDLFTYSTTQARLAVGSNGDTLVADSAATTGLRYQPTTAAGKNGIINSGFDIWQRGTSFTSNGYSADRWYFFPAGVAGRTHTRQASDLTGFAYFARVQRNSGNSDTTGIALVQSMATEESLRFAGKTVTLSFWARLGANGNGTFRPYIITGTGTDQNRAGATYTGETIVSSASSALTTSWARYSVTVSLASSIKEIAVYFDYAPTGTAGAADYFDVTGVQLEEASVATGYMRTGGTLQGELALAQRYYWRFTGSVYTPYGQGMSTSTTAAEIYVQYPVTMRVAPTTIDWSNLEISDLSNYGLAVSTLAFSSGSVGTQMARLSVGHVATATANRTAFLRAGNNSAGYLGLGAEL